MLKQLRFNIKAGSSATFNAKAGLFFVRNLAKVDAFEDIYIFNKNKIIEQTKTLSEYTLEHISDNTFKITYTGSATSFLYIRILDIGAINIQDAEIIQQE